MNSWWLDHGSVGILARARSRPRAAIIIPVRRSVNRRKISTRVCDVTQKLSPQHPKHGLHVLAAPLAQIEQECTLHGTQQDISLQKLPDTSAAQHSRELLGSAKADDHIRERLARKTRFHSPLGQKRQSSSHLFTTPMVALGGARRPSWGKVPWHEVAGDPRSRRVCAECCFPFSGFI